jgi:hypothetical protein
MYDEQTVQRFVELRASGWTYARLMTELNVSKPKLLYPIVTTIVSPSLPRSGGEGRGEEARFSTDSPRPDLQVSTCKPQHRVPNIIFGCGQRSRHAFAPWRLCVEAVSRRAPKAGAKACQKVPKGAKKCHAVVATSDFAPRTSYTGFLPRKSQFRSKKVYAGVFWCSGSQPRPSTFDCPRPPNISI